VVTSVALFVDALWIVGLAGLLATISFAEGERRLFDDPSRPLPERRRLLLPAALSLSLVGVGLILDFWLGSAPESVWAPAAAIVSSALSIILVISALRSPQRAGAEIATSGRPTS
jgi:hypothetical protein